MGLARQGDRNLHTALPVDLATAAPAMTMLSEFHTGALSLKRFDANSGRGSRGFTILELLVATGVFGLVMGITLVAYVGVMKKAFHAEALLEGAQQLRYASDLISQTVRSAPLRPVVSANGLQLTVAPEDLGIVVVRDGTWIDEPNNVRGWKSNQRTLKFSNYTAAAVTTPIFKPTAARPTGALSAADVETYFKVEDDLPEVDLNEIFSVGDTVKVPATAYGAEFERVINSISQNGGQKTVTFTQDLGCDVPQGTRVLATSGRRVRFEVMASGDLRYYRDTRDLTKFVILARDVDPAPLSNPADLTSTRTTPFVLTEGRYVTINFEKLPRGTIAGRTVQGVRTTVFARTDPSVQ